MCWISFDFTHHLFFLFLWPEGGVSGHVSTWRDSVKSGLNPTDQAKWGGSFGNRCRRAKLKNVLLAKKISFKAHAYIPKALLGFLTTCVYVET